MGIIGWTDNSHEMPSLIIFFEKYRKEIKILSAAVVISI